MMTQLCVCVGGCPLASGTSIRALINLVQQANATLVGIAALVEKRFEGGRALLSQLTKVPIVSLVTIEAMEGDTITFAADHPSA